MDSILNILINRPDEIKATKISSRLNSAKFLRARPREISATKISRGKHLTGQVGQADSRRHTLSKLDGFIDD